MTFTIALIGLARDIDSADELVHFQPAREHHLYCANLIECPSTCGRHIDDRVVGTCDAIGGDIYIYDVGHAHPTCGNGS